MTCYNISQICCIRSQTQSDLLHHNIIVKIRRQTHESCCDLHSYIGAAYKSQHTDESHCSLPVTALPATMGGLAHVPHPATSLLVGELYSGVQLTHFIAREVSIRDQCKPNIKYINTNNIVIILKCDSRIQNITNQHMKINVKCLFKVFHSNSGEKG